jgi:hypothetical protein
MIELGWFDVARVRLAFLFPFANIFIRVYPCLSVFIRGSKFLLESTWLPAISIGNLKCDRPAGMPLRLGRGCHAGYDSVRETSST